jgi:hypothetical protein
MVVMQASGTAVPVGNSNKICAKPSPSDSFDPFVLVTAWQRLVRGRILSVLHWRGRTVPRGSSRRSVGGTNDNVLRIK